jgi:hypothetical protein
VGGIVGVHVNPGPGPVIVPPPAPLPPGNDPLPPPNVLPPPQLDVAPPVPTLDAFAATFKPCPGTYEVLILHPRTHEPVKVTFSLPEGAPTRVRVTKRELDFDYGRHGVAIRFRINGTVTVKSD